MRQILILPIAAAALVAAGCTGDSGGVPANAVAVVGGETVTKGELDRLIEDSRANAKRSGRRFPKPGTAAYRQIREQLVQYLVRRAQLVAEAEARDIEVSDDDIEQKRKLVVAQYFGGSEKRYRKQLERNGITEEQARADIEASLIQEELFKDVGKDVKVTDAEMRKYYAKNKRKYGAPARREIRQILLRTNQRALARSLVDQLRSGASFAQLARRYSQDPRADSSGGRIEVAKGQSSAAFDRVVFSIPTRRVADPVRTQFGWHVIEALGPVRRAAIPPYAKVKATIRQEVLQRKRSEASSKYLVGIAGRNEVEYQKGLGPAA